MPTSVRFVSMCIVDNLQPIERQMDVVTMCTTMLCSLMLTTKPKKAPLVMVDNYTEGRWGKVLQQTGAELIRTRGVPPWNVSGALSRRLCPQQTNSSKSLSNNSKGFSHSFSSSSLCVPPGMYTYNKLHFWDPDFTNETLLVLIDADALIIRDAITITGVTPPAALGFTKICSTDKPVGPANSEYKSLIRDSYGTHSDQRGFNSGVIVFEPQHQLYHRIMNIYRQGFFKLDIRNWKGMGEQEVLIEAYWDELNQRRPHQLSDEYNFRGYKCNLLRANFSQVKIVHRRPSQHRTDLISKACSRSAEWETHVRGMVSRNQCQSNPRQDCTSFRAGVAAPAPVATATETATEARDMAIRSL